MQSTLRTTNILFGILAFLLPSLAMADAASPSVCLFGSPPDKSTTILDLLVLFPDSFPSTEAAIRSWLGVEVAHANEAFQNSEINAFYCVRAIEEVAATGLQYPSVDQKSCQNDPPDRCLITLALEWMKLEPDGLLDARNRHGADLVTLVLPAELGGPCGAANPRTTEDRKAFSVLELHPHTASSECPAEAHTLAHELGHNFGLVHDDFTLEPPIPYGKGYIVDRPLPDSDLATIMACVEEPCYREPYFSNPDLCTADGFRLGCTSSLPTCDGQSQSPCSGHFDSSRAVRERLPVVSHYAEPVVGGDPLPWIRIVQPPSSVESSDDPHDGFVGLESRAGDPQPDPSSPSQTPVVVWTRYLNEDGVEEEEVLGSGLAISVRFAKAGIHQVTVTATDSAGQSASQTIGVEVTWKPDPEDTGSTNDDEPSSIGVSSLPIADRQHNFHDLGDSDWIQVVPVADGTLVMRTIEPGDRADSVNVWLYSEIPNPFVNPDPLATATNVVRYPVEGDEDYFIHFQNDPFTKYGHDTNYKQRIFLDTPPQAAFSVQCTGSRCDFDASASTNDRGTLEYHWTFGDGTSEVTSGPLASHCYGAGNFSATLTVVDREHQSDSASQQVSVAAGNGVPTKGLWANPNRSGTGYSLIEHTPGNHALAWFTYEADGRPTWYLSGVGAAGQCWRQPLYRSQWSAGTTQSTEVGWIELRSTGQDTAMVRWELDGAPGEESVHLFQASMGRAGAWVDPSEDGWAIEIEESATHLAAYVLFYGNDGQPLWTLGTGSAAAAGWQNLPMMIFDGVGLCPSCSGGSATPPPSQPAGSIDLDIAQSTSSGQAELQVTTPYGNWIRGTIPIVRLTLP